MVHVRHIAVIALALLAIPTTASDGSQVDVQIPVTYWPDIYYPTFDSVVDLSGLEPLRANGLRNSREVRIWIGGGAGFPQEMWRLIESPQGWGGELILYWKRRDGGRRWKRLVKEDAKRGCDAPRTRKGVQVCHGDLPTGIEWSTIVSQLEASGLWHLPDASVLPPPSVDVFDGWSLTVELRAGDKYRSYQYPNPDAQKWTEAAGAAEVANALHEVGPTPRYEIDAYGRPLDSAGAN